MHIYLKVKAKEEDRRCMIQYSNYVSRDGK
jgi:hypothetical protein